MISDTFKEINCTLHHTAQNQTDDRVNIICPVDFHK